MPVSFATDAYYGVDAFRFINAAAVGRFGRYRIEPVAGTHYLDAAQTAGLKPDYLRDELSQRLASGPVAFHLVAQLAEPGDMVTDPTVAWPSDRPQVLLGTLSLTAIVPPEDPALPTLFFSPMNLVPGIVASDDPLLAARTRSYAISYRRRLAKEWNSPQPANHALAAARLADAPLLDNPPLSYGCAGNTRGSANNN